MFASENTSNEDMISGMEKNMNVKIGEKVKIEATVVDYNEGSKTVKLKIGGFQEDNYTPAERIFVCDMQTVKKTFEMMIRERKNTICNLYQQTNIRRFLYKKV